MATDDQMYALADRLASLDWPDVDLIPYVDGVNSLLEYLVVVADAQGRFYAEPALMCARMYHNFPKYDLLKMYEWRDALLRRGDITILPLAKSSYGGSPYLILTIQNLVRFYRWRNRLQIPKWIRREVYERDGHKCVKCGTTETLTLDHIIPWSRGGDDTVENLQTMCRPCNSRKGNRVEVVF